MPVVVGAVVLCAAAHAELVLPARRLAYAGNVAPELRCLLAMLEMVCGEDVRRGDIDIPVFIMHSDSEVVARFPERRRLDVTSQCAAARLDGADIARLQSDPSVRYLTLAGAPLPTPGGRGDLIPGQIDVAAVHEEAPVIIGVIDKNPGLSLEFDPELKRRVVSFWRREGSVAPEEAQESTPARSATVHGSVITGIIARHARSAGYVLVDSPWDQIDTVAGLEFIRRTAARVGKPAVVNLSAGINAGPHDGSSLFERILACYPSASFHLVVAAGNMGPACQHAEFSHRDLVRNSVSLPLTIPEEPAELEREGEASIDLWFSGPVACSVQVASPRRHFSQPVGPKEGGVFLFDDTSVYICNDISNSLNGKTNILIVLKGAKSAQLAGQWIVRLDSFPPGAFVCDAWLALGPHCRGSFTRYVSPRKTVQPPATAQGVISVGVFDGAPGARTFLSQGPSADGRPKPDVFLRSKHHTSYAAAYVTALLANWIAADAGRSRIHRDDLLAALLSEYPNVYSPGAPGLAPAREQKSSEVGKR